LQPLKKPRRGLISKYNTQNILKLIAVIIFEIIVLQNANSQDKLFFKSGGKLPVVIQKETADEIYCVKSSEDNTHLKIQKSDLKQINYANGDSIVFGANNAKAVDTVALETTGRKTGVRNATYCWIYGNSELSYKVRRGFIHSVADSGIIFQGFSIRKYIYNQ